MLKVDGLNQYYGGSHILRNVAFEAALGEVTVVLGRNGVGKTTLLKSLMGVVPIRTGAVALDGRNIARATPYERVRAGIGYVPQGREIFGRLTVEENLRMGLAYKSGGTPIPGELFELFPVLKQMLHRRGGDLSGGQQQQLAIGRALMSDPDILMLDEPSLGLSPTAVDTVFEALEIVRSAGKAILVVEQRAELTIAFCARTYVLHDGVITLTLKPEDAENVEVLTEAYFG